MKKTILAFVFALFATCLLFSCKSYVIDDEMLSSNSSSLEVRSDAGIDAEEFNVTQDMAEYYAKSFKERPTIKSIKSYDYNGVTCLYIVNFEKGWMAIPADSRIQTILGEGENDQLYDEDLQNPGIEIWLEMAMENVYRVKEDGIKEYNPDNVKLWNCIKKIVGEESNRSQEPEGNAAWVMVTNTSTTTQYNADVPHLLQTKWGQANPWFISLPIDPQLHNQGIDLHFLTGCIPTAISQVLYYFHYKTGYPNDLWHSIDPYISASLGNNKYKVGLVKYDYDYTVNSDHWDDMPLTNNGVGNFSYVSDLMMDVGVRLDVTYGVSSTSGSILTGSDIAPCGMSGTGNNYSYSTVMNNLNNQKPVLVTAGNGSSGHAWVIDGCLDKTVYSNSTTIFYEYQEGVLYPTGSVYLSESEMLAINPSPYDGYSIVNNTTEQTQYLLMNWGWYGNHDDDHFVIEPSAGSNDWRGYNIVPCIIYNITTGQMN